MRLIGLPPHRRAGALIVGARHALSETVVRIDDDVFITLKNVTREGDNSISIDDFGLGL